MDNKSYTNDTVTIDQKAIDALVDIIDVNIDKDFPKDRITWQYVNQLVELMTLNKTEELQKIAKKECKWRGLD